MDNKILWFIVIGALLLLPRKKTQSANLSGVKKKAQRKWFVTHVYEKQGKHAIWRSSRGFPTRAEAELWENKYHPKSERNIYYVTKEAKEWEKGTTPSEIFMIKQRR
jgi:hypothetical protein